MCEGGPGGAERGLLQRSPGLHHLHLLFAERLMLSSKQLMLRPSCQPEWGGKKNKKPPISAIAKGNGRHPIRVAGGGVGAWGLEPAPLGHEEAEGTVYPQKQGFEAGLVTYGVCGAGDSRTDVPCRTRERHLHCLVLAPRGASVRGSWCPAELTAAASGHSGGSRVPFLPTAVPGHSSRSPGFSRVKGILLARCFPHRACCAL